MIPLAQMMRPSAVLAAFVPAVLACGLLAALSAVPVDADVSAGGLTWVRDIAPIVEARCATCHSPHGVAFPPLSEYESARQWASAIRSAVLDRRMPPWPLARGFHEFENDASLSRYEIDRIVSWANAGAGYGTTAAAAFDSPPAPARLDEPPDLLLRPAGVRLVTAARGTFELRTETREDRWIRAWDFRPDQRALVTQAVITMAPDVILGTWVAPGAPVRYPTGIGYRVRAGARLTLEVHYRKPQTPVLDRSELALYLARGPLRELQRLRLSCGHTQLANDVEVFAIRPRMVSTDDTLQVIARRPDRTVEVLLMQRRYDPRRQWTFRFRRPVRLPRGTTVEVISFDAECHIDLEYAVT